jgi:hypothetical protein
LRDSVPHYEANVDCLAWDDSNRFRRTSTAQIHPISVMCLPIRPNPEGRVLARFNVEVDHSSWVYLSDGTCRRILMVKSIHCAKIVL